MNTSSCSNCAWLARMPSQSRSQHELHLTEQAVYLFFFPCFSPLLPTATELDLLALDEVTDKEAEPLLTAALSAAAVPKLHRVAARIVKKLCITGPAALLPAVRALPLKKVRDCRCHHRTILHADAQRAADWHRRSCVFVPCAVEVFSCFHIAFTLKIRHATMACLFDTCVSGLHA
jgi:hypothetical protein